MFDVWARRAIPHTSPEIAWSLCDGCPSLDVKDLTGTMTYKLHGGPMYEYRCDSMHGEELTKKEIYGMTEEKCPTHRKLGRR